MLPGQLDLFSTTTAPSTGVVGLQLRLPSACHCGCSVVVLGSSNAMHEAPIRCDQCRKHRGWLSRAEFDRITAVIGKSGRPTEPIDIS